MGRKMKYLSVCSGFGGAELAFDPLGWHCVGVSDIEPAACSVLSSRWPNTPNLGDFTKIGVEDVRSIDLLVGGTPCQSFSVAGLRGGLGDDRGNLALEFLRLADRTRPRWILWENVPGVYSATSHIAPDPCPPQIDLDGPDGPKDGEEIVVEDEYDTDEHHAFSCFLAGLSELGYGYAYGTLDAQYFGVPQRRRRVFVVGYLGNWSYPAAVLFERHCLSGHPAPSREKREGFASTVTSSPPSRRNGGSSPTEGQFVAGTLGGGNGARGWNNSPDVAGAFIPFTPSSHGSYDEGTGTLRSNGGDIGGGQRDDSTWPADVTQTLDTKFGSKYGQENQHIDGGATLFVPCSNLPPSEGRRPNDGQLCGDRGFL